MHAQRLRATLHQHLGEDKLRAVGGPIAWLRRSARFQNEADLYHYEHGLEMAGLGGA